MNELLFIRHAETDMAGRFCGHSDPPVNGAGVRQIEELLAAMHDERIDAVYTSDLQRARMTAQALVERFNVPCAVRPALREISFGEWEGRSWSEIEAISPDHARQWIAAYPGLPAPGGEAYDRFRRRVLDEVHALLQLADRGRVAVVTHAGVIRVVLQELCGVGEQEAWSRTRQYCCQISLDRRAVDNHLAAIQHHDLQGVHP